MISIIIPLYNKEKAIARAIDSVICQTYTDWECVIINDGSTDGSVDVVKSFLPNEKIRLIHQENSGVSKARNRGLDEAKGEWVIFLDADDVLLENCLSSLCNKIVLYPNIDVVCGNFYTHRKKSLSDLEGYIYNNYKANFFNHILLRAGACIIRRDFHLRYRYDERYSRFEDLELILRMYKEARIYRIRQSVMVYTDDYSDLRSRYLEYSKDYTSNLDFKQIPFWGKCTLGLMLYLARFGYPEKQKELWKQYGFHYLYMYIAGFVRKVIKLKKKLQRSDVKKNSKIVYC